MLTVALVTMLILLQYMYFSARVGMLRGKVPAPAMTGDELFERRLRVQLNTLEQLIVTLPALWVCAHFFRPDVAAILGTVFIVGRFIFSATYVKNPPSRTLGFVLGFLANVGLILCSLWAIGSKLL